MKTLAYYRKILVLCMCSLVYPAVAQAAIYKCTNAKKEIVFSDKPCEEPGAKEEVKDYSRLLNRIDTSPEQQAEEAAYILDILETDKKEPTLTEEQRVFLQAELERVQQGLFIKLDADQRRRRREALSALLNKDSARYSPAELIAQIEAIYPPEPADTASEAEIKPVEQISKQNDAEEKDDVSKPTAQNTEQNEEKTEPVVIRCRMENPQMQFNPETGLPAYFGVCSNSPRQSIECILSKENNENVWECDGISPYRADTLEKSANGACGCAG